MNYSHLFLKNPVGTKDYVNTNRFVPQEEEDEEEEVPADYTYQKNTLHRNLIALQESRRIRIEKRTIDLPAHFEYIEIRFFAQFNNAANYYNHTFGLDPISYSDFNKTVLFHIESEVLFQNFIRLIEDFYNSPANANPRDQAYHVLTLIHSFEFLSSSSINKTSGDCLIISLTDLKAGQKVRNWENVKMRLLEYIREKEGTITFVSDNIFELNNIKDYINEIVDNFDIIQEVQSTPPIHVEPSSFGTTKYGWGFRTTHEEQLPIIGIIDSGIATIEPLEELIKGETSILDRPMGIGSDHGTNVASIVAFGSDLKNISTEKKADAYLYSIQVLYRENGSFSLYKLKQEIIKAHKELGVRIFNLSICGISYDYNSNFSYYAMILDELAYTYDLLIFIACGNYDLESADLIKEIEGSATHLVNYPNHYYNTVNQDYSQPSNLGSPAESMNNITIGAIASNLRCNSVDLTTAYPLPAYYSRKYHIDYSQNINGSGFTNNQRNKNIFKPDILMPGGDWNNPSCGINVLGRGLSFKDYNKLTAGTSIATPIAVNLACRLISKYPLLNMQSIKALLINSSVKTNINTLLDPIIEQCKENKAIELFGCSFNRLSRSQKISISKLYKTERLSYNIEGHGVIDEDRCLNSTEKRVSLIIEDTIKFKHYRVQHIKIPDYLLETNKNKVLRITTTLCFKFTPIKKDQMAYNPIHISFNFINAEASSNESARVIANQGSQISPEVLRQRLGIHTNMESWSDDFSALNRKLFSNSQKKSFVISKSEIIKTNNEIALVVRCVGKTLHWDSGIENPYSLVVTIEEYENLGLTGNLYEELSLINNLEAVTALENLANIDLNN